MITHRGIWAIAHMLSHSLQTFMHSWRVLPKTFVNSVSNKHHSWTHTRHRVQQTCAVWAKRTEYSIEQIRQSLQRLKIAKIVRMQNLHNFRTIDSVFFRHTFAIQVVNHWPTPIANSLRSGARHAACSRARVHDIWATIHMSSQQLAATDCFHCVTKVGYS